MSHFTLLAKAALTAGLIWLLFDRVDIGGVPQRFAAVRPDLLVVAIVLIAMQLPLAALRWRLIMGAIGTAPRFVPTLRIFAICHFFNQALVSTVFGDAARVLLVKREGQSLGNAVYGVLLDRGIGMIGLVVVTAVGLPFLGSLILDASMQIGLFLFVASSLAGFILFPILANAHLSWLDRWPPTRWLRGLAVALRTIFVATGTALTTMVLAVLVQLLSVFAMLVLARALEVPLGLVEALLFVPPIILVSMLPISLAGWGVREGAMVTALAAIGIGGKSAFALSVLFGLVLLVVSLPGCVLWLAGRSRGSQVPAADAALARVAGRSNRP